MSEVLIRPLCERGEWVDLLAVWHHREWDALYGGSWTLSAARGELAAHASARS